MPSHEPLAAGARLFLTLGAVNGVLGVVAGAFGAHALRARLDERMLNAFETGARYHLVHAVALLAVGLWLALRPASATAQAGGWAMLVGIVLFSGSLYAMALSGVRVLGAITPVGGVAFIVGWALLAVAAWRG